MRKSFALIFLLIAAAFAAVTWLRRAPEAADPDASDTVRLNRGEIQEFWSYYHRATELRVEGGFEEAAQLYRRALGVRPDHEESLYYLGNCQFELGDYEAARRQYEKLLKLNPSSQRALSQLGILLSSPLPGVEPDWERAIEAFRKSIDVNREESGPFLRLGFLELRRGRDDAALEHFQTAAGFRSPEGMFMAGVARFRMGEYDQAAALFQKVLEIRGHEDRISGRGVRSEGDVDSGQATLTPLEAAALKSEAFLAWLPASAGRRAPQDFDQRAALDQSRVRPCSAKPADREWAQLGRAAAADWDGDGDADLAAADPEGGVLLLRRSGSGFQRAAVTAPASGPLFRDVVWGDFDADGDLDLYAVGSGWTGRGENRLLRNDCRESTDCRFVDVTPKTGLSGSRNTLRALFLDIDGDGRPELLEAGAGETPLRLYRNRGGLFELISDEAGLRIEGTVVDVAAGDFDADGRVDLLVARWKRPALLFLNQANGRFRQADGRFEGGNPQGTALSVLAFDYDGDGLTDLLIASLGPWERSLQFLLNPRLRSQTASPKLFRNIDGRRFQDVTGAADLDRVWGITQAVPLDFDQDGWTDLLFANGGLETYRLEPSVLLRNEEGRRFTVYARLPGLDSPAHASGAAAIDWEGNPAPEIQLVGAGCYRINPR